MCIPPRFVKMYALMAEDRHNVSEAQAAKNEEFQRYLESSRALEVLTNVLNEMYELEKKPSDPLTYFTKSMGAKAAHAREIEALKEEIRALRSVMENLERENKILRERIEKKRNQSSMKKL